MIRRLRHILWRVLGFDYQMMLNKTDYTLLQDDNFTIKGVGTYANGAKVWRWSNAKLIIGNYCSIANNVNFIMDEGNHTDSPVTNYPLKERIPTEFLLDAKNKKQKEGITLGNDIWIGMGSYIMPGVSIGNGAIIAANSVVTKDVPDYAMFGGSPAKLIKMKHDDKLVSSLNIIAWWNWDYNKIKKHINDFYLPIDQFIEKHGK
ncbi:CatB-related O-acetyltransferase [Yeosuana marina]|uniref:CatB-related O-acetyltransferase n=1 Tax=Yeosuana marina TaxID=1565536 RepID=UPI00141E0E3F|nr:CatB-related O-acetyltransferase [Yeosuana marina]